MVAFCQDCCDALCQRCYDAHLRVKLTANHLITVIANPLPSIVAGDPECEEPMADDVEKPRMMPLVERALRNDTRCRQFTGIPLFLFNFYMQGLKGKFVKNSKFSPHDQLALCFNMLKTNETNIQLGINFGANEDTVSAILKHVINILFELSRRWLWWFSREELDLTMFKTFKASFPKNRVIIDGTEIKTQMPKSITEAVLMWSTYKSAYTWKELVVTG